MKIFLFFFVSRSTADLNSDSDAEDDAISNTKWFLIEENKNFEFSQEDELVDVELNTVLDPSCPPEKGKGHNMNTFLILYCKKLKIT